MTEIAWYRTPMREEMLLQRIKNNPTLLAIVRAKKDITIKLDEDINHRLNGGMENFVTLYIISEQGNFKSSVAQSISTKYDPNFTENNVCMTYEEFENMFKESKPKTFHILDELVFQHGMGSTRVIHDFQTKIEVLRKRQMSTIVCTPEAKYFPENIFTYVLEPFDNSIQVTCPYNKKNHETRNCKCYPEKKFLVKEAYVRCAVKKEGQYIGFYIVPIEWSTPLWSKYTQKKDAFNEMVIQQQQNQSDYRGKAQKMLADPDSKQYRTKKALKLLCYKMFPNVTTQESEMIVEEASILRRIEEANQTEDVEF